MSKENDVLYAGIDAGSVSINCILINHDKIIVYESPYIRHFGKVEEKTMELIQDLYQKFGKERIRAVSFTGNHGRKLSERLGTFYEFETITEVLGAIHLHPDVMTVISMGGQDTSFFEISHVNKKEPGSNGGWELEYFNTNGPCASGTGSFLDQQAQRLATAIYDGEKDRSVQDIDKILADFIELGLKSSNPASVACRCTVFTKSDMIHLQNKGETLEDIIYGLHVGNARNYMSTIVSNRNIKKPVLFTGGLSMNALQVKAFREYIPDLIVPPHNASTGALGVALQALELGIENRIDVNSSTFFTRKNRSSVPLAQKLSLKYTVFPENNDIENKNTGSKTGMYLGIDIGSTTTKYVLIDEDRRILFKDYTPTQGKPIETVQKLLKSLYSRAGQKIEIKGVATTGSGRNVAGDFLDADLIIDEITAHATGAVEIDRDVDTIFEIGGQDSKYISISNSYPLDFDMNKVCAAGTGSFLHELANKYGVNIIGEFQDIALSSEKPVRLAERCTVFMESDLVTYLQKGISKDDVIAGLCYAIAYNYLNRVVGKRAIGKKVMFLGGPSLNKGVVAAFENILGRALSVPRHREVLGAYGAAIRVQHKMFLENRNKSSFRGFASAINDHLEYVEKGCSADPYCHNQCKLKVYDFDGRKNIWGGECGRYEIRKRIGAKKENAFKLRDDIWHSFMDGVYCELGDQKIMETDNRPTIGMQRALYGNQTSIIWAHFFDRLGFRLVLTPPTNTRISDNGIEAMVAETCYPVKVSHGHIKELLLKTRYLFIPSIITMPATDKTEEGCFCPMVQNNSYMVRQAMDIDPSTIINPVIHMKYDPETLSMEISDQIRDRLGVSRKDINNAIHFAFEKYNLFKEELYEKGRQFLSSIDDNEPFIVVTGRPYNLYDERLNLRLGKNLGKIEIAALPMDFIDVSSIDLSDFPSMYWGLGAQILRTVKFMRDRPNCFGLHLTNFSCGPDSFIEHFYKYLMKNKPFLILELDEHSAVAGVMTRIEAFKNVIENSMHESCHGYVNLSAAGC